MSEQPDEAPHSDSAAALQREILAGREFSLSEAIGRMAGGLMKGASPITGQRQAEMEIEEYLRHNLADTGGTLEVVLLRDVGQSDLLLNNYDKPLVVLSQCITRILESDYLLRNLVQEADVEWGRVFRERPHFEKPDCPPHPDDPYTIASVRDSLSRLIDKLTSDETSASG